MATIMDSSRKPMIVIFKRKNKRSSKSDKQKIMKEVVSSSVEFLRADDFANNYSRALAADADSGKIGFDTNRFKAPILMAHLNDAEIAALRKHKDMQRVEEDGLMYALTMPGTVAAALNGIPV